MLFTDKLSSAVSTVRPGLAAMLHYAREGDTVVVTPIDRLGRSVAEVTPHHRRAANAARIESRVMSAGLSWIGS